MPNVRSRVSRPVPGGGGQGDGALKGRRRASHAGTARVRVVGGEQEVPLLAGRVCGPGGRPGHPCPSPALPLHPFRLLEAARGTAGHTSHATSPRSLSRPRCAGRVDGWTRSPEAAPGLSPQPGGRDLELAQPSERTAPPSGPRSAGLWRHLRGERGCAEDPGTVVPGPRAGPGRLRKASPRPPSGDPDPRTRLPPAPGGSQIRMPKLALPPDSSPQWMVPVSHRVTPGRIPGSCLIPPPLPFTPPPAPPPSLSS